MLTLEGNIKFSQPGDLGVGVVEFDLDHQIFRVHILMRSAVRILADRILHPFIETILYFQRLAWIGQKLYVAVPILITSPFWDPHGILK